MKLRIILPLILTLVITQSDSWLPHIYEVLMPSDFFVLGPLNHYQVPCNSGNCAPEYDIPLKGGVPFLSKDWDLPAIGAGRFFGSLNWYCHTGGTRTKIFVTGSVSTVNHSMGLLQYQSTALPRDLCSDFLEIRYEDNQPAALGKSGWKEGLTVIGSLSAVSAFKSISDFFASYLRALLGFLGLLFVVFELRLTGRYVFGTYWYKVGTISLALASVASSSVLDLLLPGVGLLGFPLLKASGTIGFAGVCLALLEITTQKRIRLGKRQQQHAVLLGIGCIAIFLLYFRFTGIIYTLIQASLSLGTLYLSYRARAVSTFVLGGLLVSDLLAIRGILPGFPSNLTIHYFLLAYSYDAFERLLKTNSAIEEISGVSSVRDSLHILANIGNRFGLRRISYSVFSRENTFDTSITDGLGNADKVYTNSDIPRLSASVMTSRSPLLRVRVDSNRAAIIRGSSVSADLTRGVEYCVFPLIHAQKVIGTLNITGYSPASLGDPSQMTLYLSLIEKLLPRFAETLYKNELSPNQKEESEILAIESQYISSGNKSFLGFRKSMDMLCSRLDMKLIISRKEDNESRLKTFSNHNYSKDISSFLDSHSAALSETIVASPANVSYSRKEPVFINDIVRLFPVYPEFLVQLFIQNNTKSLWVAPVLNANDSVWGVIWIEFINKTQMPDADLRDLATILSTSIEKQLKAFFEHETQARVKNELGMLIPKRVLEKIESGLELREEEEGFLLNIDLAGSTDFAKKNGDTSFSLMVSEVSLNLSRELKKFGFTQQMIIWDAFIFTCSKQEFSKFTFSLSNLRDCIEKVVAELSVNQKNPVIGFRAVLHYGDTTRDLTIDPIRTWGITGSALAESCKIEATIKNLRNEVYLSREAAVEIHRKKVA